VFKSVSTKNLLQLWSLGTIFAIAIMAVVSIYINAFFSERQLELAEKVEPMQGLSRQVSRLATLLAAREKQLLVSVLQGTATADIPTQQLEKDFNTHWQQLSTSVENDPKIKVVTEAFWQDYQQFLKIDAGLIESVGQHQVLTHAVVQRVDSIERWQQQVQVLLKKVLINGVSSTPTNQLKLEQLHHAFDFQLSKIIKFVFKIEQQKKLGNSFTESKNGIQSASDRLRSQLVDLKRLFTVDSNLSKTFDKIEQKIIAIQKAAVSGDASLYNAMQQALKVKKELIVQQQQSIAALNELVSKLNELSVLISKQNQVAVRSAISTAENTRWLIIGLALLMALGMAKLFFSISRRINEPLSELRSAMHALSSREFNTRLNYSENNNEFSLLAADFNQFASNTQSLIQDLDLTKQSLQEQKQELRTILDGVPEAIMSLSKEGVVESTNPHAAQVLNADEASLLGQSFVRFFADNQQLDTFDDIIKQQETNKEFNGVDFNGKPFSMWLSLNQITTINEQHWVCVISDVTAWKETEQKLTTTSSELDTILDNAMVGIAFIKDRSFLRVNQKFEDIFGYSKEEIVGKSTQYLCATDEVLEQLAAEAYSLLDQGETFEGVMQFAKHSGDLFWCGLSCKAISPEDPEQGTIWLFEDVTAQRESDEKLRNLANLDGLTGLPNRNVFNDRLSHAIHKAHRNAKRLAIFFLDLDHFKHINDSLGHKAGDQLLCEVAKRLKGCVREGDTVARLGGDEFTVILEDIQSVQYVAKVAEKVLVSVLESYKLGTTEVNVSPSIGISLYPSDGRDVDVLLKNADAAMYHAKNSGRNNFQFYSAEMNAQAVHRLEMETCLRRAVEQKDFYLHFQPQIDLNSKKIIGAEALLRWHTEQWGDVSPVEFIPILEDTGLIGTVGETVLMEACKAYMSLQGKLDPDFKIAVNLSGRQFKGAPLATYVRNVLQQTGMSAHNLELEITESILMEDTNLAIRTLSELSELGITLAVDDFGTGYSSLSYLKQFPLNVLKIDKSFIDDVTHGNDDAGIVEAILAMSGHLKLDVVAEGIETVEQLNFLQERDCHRGQGYYFSRPLDFQAFETLVDDHADKVLTAIA
jgi:diguanylate cyclase (GGDEF)-like protein/PAS domain S-box-containing protein